MRSKQLYLILAGIFIFRLGLLFGYSGTQIPHPTEPPEGVFISLPKLAAATGDTLDLPVTISGLAGQSVYSLFLKIAYDPAVLEIVAVESSGSTLAWQTPIWNLVDGELRISAYGTQALTSNGEALNIRAVVLGEEGTLSHLTFNLATLNEGSPAVQANSGKIFIGIPYPWFEELATQYLDEGTLLNLRVWAFDPLDKALQITVLGLPDAATCQDLGDGSAVLNWQTDYLSAGTYTLELNVLNSDSLSAQTQLSIQIANVPRPPIIHTPFADFSFEEDSSYQAYLLADHVSDSDLNQGDQLTLSLEGNTHVSAWLEDGSIMFTSTADWFGSETLSLVISDTHGFYASQSITVTVINVNDTPIQIQALPSLEIDEDHPGYQLELSDFFGDIDNQLVYSIEGALHLTSQVTGSLLTIIPEADWFGTETLTIVATEGSLISPAAMASLNQFRNLSISAQLVVQVFPINDPPVIHQAFPTVSMYMNQSFTLEGLSSYVSDLDSELLFSFQGNANISLEKLGNSLVITPDQDWIGIRRISVGISDDFDAIVEMDLTVIVRASFLYEEDFDHAGSLPSGWTRTGTAWTAYLQEGTDYAARISNPQLSSTQRLVTSTINLSSIRNPVISFYHELTRPVGLTATLQYSISNGITYYNIENFTASTSGWYSIPVPQLENQANVKLRWHYLSSTVNLNSWLIDDFSISGEYGDFSAPPQVTSLSVSSAGTNFVSLSWNPVEDTFFERYEISVRSDLNIGSQLFVWSVEQDPSLVHSAQNGTVITGLNHLAGYYFFIRAKDLSNNSSPWSDPAFAIASPLPQIQILTGDDVWFNSHNPSLAFRITDDQMVSASSLRYRIDQDLNGSYDESEPWTPVSGYSDAALIEVEIPVTISTDGLNFHYELSCTDTQNPIYAYSGSEYSEGIGDDPTFNVDTGAPQTVSGFVTQAVSPTQVILAWDASLDSAFREYEILYGFSPDPGLESTSWGTAQDASLALISTSSTTITNLESGLRYWFKIRVFDLAGNSSELSPWVTNVLPGELPLCYAPQPLQGEQAVYHNSLSVTIGCSFSDAYGIDQSSVEYRFDANGNGVYDAEESWIPVFSRGMSRIAFPEAQIRNLNSLGDLELEVLTPVTYLSEGSHLAFEFRARDVHGSGFRYSGSALLEGIADDWFVMIDATAPAPIQAITLGLVTPTAAEIFWTSSFDLNFIGYVIYYGHEPGIGLQSSQISYLEHPELQEAGEGTSSFVMDSLLPESTYYLRIAAFDLAGNYALSEEVSFFTSSAVVPRAPQNLVLNIQGEDLLLSWDAVSEDINGLPVSDIYYAIYLSDLPEVPIDESTFFDVTDGTSYALEGVVGFVDHLFFRVIAIK